MARAKTEAMDPAVVGGWLRTAKKWELNYVLWKELNDEKKGNGKSNASTCGVIDLDDDNGECVDNTGGDGTAARACRPGGHKAKKVDIARQARSLAFQETLRKILKKKEEAITEREETPCKEKEATFHWKKVPNPEIFRYFSWTWLDLEENALNLTNPDQFKWLV